MTYNQKTHTQFIKELEEKFPELFNSIEFLKEYKSANRPILVKTKYGICNIIPYTLLIGCTPSIKSAINPTEYWINQAKEKHGNLYDYSLVKYVNSKTKVKIKCKCCKIFEVLPSNHMKPKAGCPYCNFIKLANSKKSNTDNFIKESQLKHNFKYTYEKTKYELNIKEVIITCLIHGDYMQTPASHLAGHGCRICGTEHLKKINRENSSGWTYSNWIKAGLRSKKFDSYKIYVIKCWNDNETFYKIGRTFLTVKNRFPGKESMPYNYKVIKIIINDADKICKLEHNLKKEHKLFKYTPKLKFNGQSECYCQINSNLINEK